jgi:D-serine deaminase-like pyridoxal phosphate-dependent protein
LVIQTSRARDIAIGDALYAVPAHICPTVALHAHAHAIQAGEPRGVWPVVARDRLL